MSTVLVVVDRRHGPPGGPSAEAAYRIGNPTRVDVMEELPGLVDGADVAVARLLGGKRAWRTGSPR